MILLTEIEESGACPNPVGARGNRELFISLEITLRFFSKSFLGNRGQRSEGRGFPAEFTDLKQPSPADLYLSPNFPLFTFHFSLYFSRRIRKFKKQISADRFYNNCGQQTEVRGRSKLKPTTHNKQLITQTLNFALFQPTTYNRQRSKLLTLNS